MKTLFFDCFAGASGNMILGALVGLGVDKQKLVEQLKLLTTTNFSIEFETIDKSGISALHAEVKVPHEHAHRHLHHIEKIINDSQLSNSIKDRAIRIFTQLATAEAKVHGTAIEKIHFHEVGAMDAIIDVVGACIGFEMLEIENFVCSKIHTGSGFVKMAHGKYPIPPPAVAELLKNVPIYSTEIEGELITPTGAAIIATVCESFGKLPEMTVEQVSYGAGTRSYKDFPNVLRLIVGNQNKSETKISDSINISLANKNTDETQNLLLLETNIDDLAPQNFGFVMERAFQIGAFDCWFTSIQMKKNRPATMISILCEEKYREALVEMLYIETSTLGVRIKQIERDCLPRETTERETVFGKVKFKVARYKGNIINYKPEYDQLREIALQLKKSLREVEEEVLRNFEKEID